MGGTLVAIILLYTTSPMPRFPAIDLLYFHAPCWGPAPAEPLKLRPVSGAKHDGAVTQLRQMWS